MKDGKPSFSFSTQASDRSSADSTHFSALLPFPRTCAQRTNLFAMGGCASTLKEWKEEAENDDEVIKASPAAPGPPAVGLAPASYLPAPSGNGDAAVPPLPPASGGLPPGQDGAPLPWHYRNSQELSMAHLVRHPRLQPFQPLGECAPCPARLACMCILAAAPLPTLPRIAACRPPMPCHAGGQFGLDAAYTPIRLLGRGGTGQTWLCSEVATGRQYALKLQQRPIPRNTVRLTYNEVTVRQQQPGEQGSLGVGRPVRVELAGLLLYSAGTPVHISQPRACPALPCLHACLAADPGGHLLQQRAHEPHTGGAAVSQPPGAGAGL